MRDEEALIRRIARAVPSLAGPLRGDHGLRLGIGDDAAVLSSGPGTEWVVSCDAFIEGVHFLPDAHPADSVGYKALVRAASDLVAMGAVPKLFLLTLALPAPRSGQWLDEFLRGMRRAARCLDMRLAGGDTTASTMVSISVAVLGRIDGARKRKGRSGGERSSADDGHVLTRSGARAGDRICITGALGRAQLGLELVRRGCIRRPGFAPLLRQHLYPRLRVKLGLWLARNGVASAMMDLSDGLSSDLTRLCRASGVGAKLREDKIPTVSLPAKVAKLLPGREMPIRQLQMALHGGEDYELLFTVPPRKEKQLRRAPQSGATTCIGEITHDRRILLVDAKGHAKPLKPAGWDPFRK